MPAYCVISVDGERGSRHLSVLESISGALPPTPLTVQTPGGMEWRTYACKEGEVTATVPVVDGVSLHPSTLTVAAMAVPALPAWVLQAASLAAAMVSSSTPAPPRQQRSAPTTTPSRFRPLTDLGNAERIIDGIGDEVKRCDAAVSGWLQWNDKSALWEDSGERIATALRQLDVAILADAAQLPRSARRGVPAFINYSQSERGITAAQKLVETAPGMRLSPDELNADPYAVQCRGLLYDVRTLSHRRAGKLDRNTVATPFEPDFKHKPSRWLAFLDDVFYRDATLIDYMKTLLGYALTGLNVEQFFWFITGPKNNGKSTLMDAVEHAIGQYSIIADERTFFSRRMTGIRNDLVAIKDARLVSIRELSPGTSIDETVVRKWTSGEGIPARLLYKEEIRFKPVGKLLILTNHLPTVRGAATWRRIQAVPMLYEIPHSKRDVLLGAALRLEAPQILAWLLEGAHQYTQRPNYFLHPPQRIVDYIAQMRSRNDPVYSFLLRNTQPCNGQAVAVVTMYQRYCRWTRDSNLRAYSYPSFVEALSERGVSLSGVPELAYNIEMKQE